MITKDQSIVTQVAAKIASDLAIAARDVQVEQLISDWAIAFEAVNDELYKVHSFQGADAASEAVIHAFPGTTVVAGDNSVNTTPRVNLFNAIPLAARNKRKRVYDPPKKQSSTKNLHRLPSFVYVA